MSDSDREATQKRLERLAWLLDSSIPIPWFNFRIGIESALGLIPGVGDAVGAVLSSYVIAMAYRLGVSKSTLIRMGANVAVETLVGAIPFFGDIFDFAWKANQRNVKLLQAHVQNPPHTARVSCLVLVVIGVALLALIALGIYLAVLFLHWLAVILTA